MKMYIDIICIQFFCVLDLMDVISFHQIHRFQQKMFRGIGCWNSRSFTSIGGGFFKFICPFLVMILWASYIISSYRWKPCWDEDGGFSNWFKEFLLFIESCSTTHIFPHLNSPIYYGNKIHFAIFSFRKMMWIPHLYHDQK